MTTNTRPSIDTYGDQRFQDLATKLYRVGFHQAGSGDQEAKALADYIDAKLTTWGAAQHEEGRQTTMRAMQRGVRELERVSECDSPGMVSDQHGPYVGIADVVALVYCVEEDEARAIASLPAKARSRNAKDDTELLDFLARHPELELDNHRFGGEPPFWYLRSKPCPNVIFTTPVMGLRAAIRKAMEELSDATDTSGLPG